MNMTEVVNGTVGNATRELYWQHEVMRVLNTHVLFFQILFGSSGNILNLIVLLSKNMRTRTNVIFAFMAFADLFFLLFHIPKVLFFWGILRSSLKYRTSSYFFVGLANWFSAISIWCMMYATIERLQVFSSPFRLTKRTISPRFVMMMIFLMTSALLVTAVHFTKSGSDYGTLKMIHAFTVIVFPLIVCSALNIMLLIELRKSKIPVQLLNASTQIQQSIISARSKNERKITVMVMVIISSFIIFNMPGAVLFALLEYNPTLQGPLNIAMTKEICNSLAVTGKVLNFALFCLSSEHFRVLLKRRLVSSFACSLQQRRPSCRSATKTHSIPLVEL